MHSRSTHNLSRRRIALIKFDRRLFILAAAGAMAFRSSNATANPRRFGARGIGTGYDDTDAIQMAIDTVWKAGGGNVEITAPPKFYNVTRSLICRPGVSLIGDGTFPTIRATNPTVNLLLAGNLHPDFVARAKHDFAQVEKTDAQSITLEDQGAKRRYHVGDQVLVTSRSWGRTDGFPIPRYAWLNIVKRVDGERLILREPIDCAIAVQVTRLADTQGRDGIPLFFYADATISGLRLEAVRHIMGDSAMLHVVVSDNRLSARTGIYGNTFQYVRWQNNLFEFTHAAGEQSLNSFRTIAKGNHFRFRPGSSERLSSGFYFQEYARDILLDDNSIDLGDFPGGGFLISITGAQDVRVSRLKAHGRMRNLIYMGAAGHEDFAITGNEIVRSVFDVGGCDRLILVDGCQSSKMHDNRITDCTFTGPAAVKDGVRVQRLRGTFDLTGNRWDPTVGCFTMQQSRGLSLANNRRGLATLAQCTAIS